TDSRPSRAYVMALTGRLITTTLLSLRPNSEAAVDPATFGKITETRTGVVTDLPLLDEILDPYREGLGTGYWGYRAHCYRMVNWARFVTRPEPYREEKLAIMTVLHDVPFFLTQDLDYLPT